MGPRAGKDHRKHYGSGSEENGGNCVSSLHQADFVKWSETKLCFQQECEVPRLAMSQGRHAYSLTFNNEAQVCTPRQLITGRAPTLKY